MGEGKQLTQRLSTFGLYSSEGVQDPNQLLFSVSMRKIYKQGENAGAEIENRVYWSTPFDSDSCHFKVGKFDDFNSVSFEYDPTSGYIKIMFGDAKVHEGTTYENLSIKAISFNSDIDFASTGHLYISDVKAEVVPHTTTVLHGINGGDFTGSLPSSVPGGQWTYWANWAPSAHTKWVPDQYDADSENKNGYAELFQQWYPHNARITYTDDGTTPIDKPWRVSVDLKGTYTTRERSDLFYLLDENGTSKFIMEIIGKKGENSNSTLKWFAGSQNGTVLNTSEVGEEFFKTFSFEYNPLSGEAVGLIEGKKVFSTFTDKNLTVKSVCVENRTYDANRWDPGILYVDNFKAELISDLSSKTILNNVNGGDFTNITLETTGGTTVHGGWWQRWTEGGANTSVNIIGSGDDRHVELSQEWYPRKANVMYVDYNGTTAKQAWRVSADIKGTYTRHYRNDIMELQGENGNTLIKIRINGKIGGNAHKSHSTYEWSFYDPTTSDLIQIDSIIDEVELNNVYQNIALEYNPITGELIGYFNDKQTLKTIIDLNLKVFRIVFSNTTNASTYDPGILFIDNIKTEPIQNRDIRMRGIATYTLEYNVLKEIKKKFGSNHIRYYLAPWWNGADSGTATHKWGNLINGSTLTNNPIYYPDWVGLEEGLANARRLGLSVTVNLHQTTLHPNDWSPSSTMGDSLQKCWRDITRITKNRNQNLRLEIYNEPGFGSQTVPAMWKVWSQEVVDSIRYGSESDTLHPVVITTGPGALDWGFRDFPLTEDDYHEVIYTLHQWKDEPYTHNGISDDHSNDPNVVRPTKSQIRDYVKASKEFFDFYGFKMFVGEFGTSNKTFIQNPEKYIFIKESIEVWEEYGWDWQFWAWDNDTPGSWHIEDAETVFTDQFTERGLVVKKVLELND